MSDENQTQQTTEAPLANSPEARTATGELLDHGVKAPEAKTEEAAAKPEVTNAAPEKYEEFKVPEGTTLDAAMLEAATPIFKELGLSQESAQKLVDLHNQLAGNAANAAIEAVNAMRAEWRTQLASDKEIGGKLEHVSAEIGKAKSLLPAEVRTAFDAAMDMTGAGDNPAIVRAFYELALKVNEGRPVTGSGPSPLGQNKDGQNSRPSVAEAMYPNLRR